MTPEQDRLLRALAQLACNARSDLNAIFLEEVRRARNAYNDAMGEPEQEPAKPETKVSTPNIESAADRLKGLSVSISADGVRNYSGCLNKQSRIAVARAILGRP